MAGQIITQPPPNPATQHPVNPTVVAYLNAMRGDPNAATVVSYKFDPTSGVLVGFDAKGNTVVSDAALAPALHGTALYAISNGPPGSSMFYTSPSGQDLDFGNGPGGQDISPATLAALGSALGVHINMHTLTYQQYKASRGTGYYNLDVYYDANGNLVTPVATPPPGTPRTGGGSNDGPGAGQSRPVFTPTGQTVAGTDPFQPVGQGFGTDYGLNPTSDPNFAFGSGVTAVGAQTPAAGRDSRSGSGVNGPTVNVDPSSIQQIQDVRNDPTRTVGGIAVPNPLGSQQPAAPGRPAGPGGIQGQPALSTQPPPGPTGQPGAGATGSAVGGNGPAPGGGTYTVPVNTPGSGSGSGSGSGTADQQGALASLTATLNLYGLGSMASWAWGEIVAGKSQQQVLLDLMQTQQFKQRFPAIEARQKAGLPAISPGDYVNYEAQATQLMRAAGLPSGFWDAPSDFTHLIAADVSINELTSRVNLATQAAYQVPADVRATLTRDYGVGAGQLAAFFLDDKTALPLIQRDFQAAQIGGAAYRTGYGSTRSQDEYLTDLGTTAGQAQQGFTQLTLQRQLFSGLPGENTTGISRDDQLAATFAGNAQDQEKIVRRAQTRTAVFGAGGGFATGQSGFAVGTAEGV